MRTMSKVVSGVSEETEFPDTIVLVIAAITTIIARVTDTEAEKGIVREALILRAKHDSVAPAQCSNFH